MYKEIAVTGSTVMTLEVDTGMTLGETHNPFRSTFTYLHSILAPVTLLHDSNSNSNTTNGCHDLSFHLKTQK